MITYTDRQINLFTVVSDIYVYDLDGYISYICKNGLYAYSGLYDFTKGCNTGTRWIFLSLVLSLIVFVDLSLTIFETA